MKVLIVSKYDLLGGAARAAYRLHQALLEQGVDSHMLVHEKVSDDLRVHCNYSLVRKGFNSLRFHIDRFPVRKYKDSAKVYFSTASTPFSDIAERINQIEPDVVHFHWVNAGMLKVEDMLHIKAPIIWSLHDMWAFTGGCHYDDECEAYKLSCGNCKVLKSNVEEDLSRKVFNRKLKAFSQLKSLTVIGLSRWLARCANESTLFKDKKVINLPNPINTKTFRPFDKAAARRLWNLPQDKKLVLFGIFGTFDDPRKGFYFLQKALSQIKDENIELVIFGSSEPSEPQGFEFKAHYVGSLSDDVSLVALYSAADVTVVPSTQENLSNTIVESLSCGTPSVGFDIGGNSDIIDHQKNGYLAKPFDASDLAHGISWALDEKSSDEVAKCAREKAVEQFSNQIVAKKYIKTYESLLKNA